MALPNFFKNISAHASPQKSGRCRTWGTFSIFRLTNRGAAEAVVSTIDSKAADRQMFNTSCFTKRGPHVSSNDGEDSYCEEKRTQGLAGLLVLAIVIVRCRSLPGHRRRCNKIVSWPVCYISTIRFLRQERCAGAEVCRNRLRTIKRNGAADERFAIIPGVWLCCGVIDAC